VTAARVEASVADGRSSGSESPRPQRAGSRRGARMSHVQDRTFAMLLMAPAAVFLGAFVAWPLVRLVVDSFYEISPIAGGPRTFVGLENYSHALQSDAFTSAALRTVAYTGIVVTAEFVLGLAAALLFSMLGSRSSVFRTVFLYPLMIAPVVAGLLWRFLLIDNIGIVNELLAKVGLLSDADAIGWLSNPDIVLFSVALPDIWLATSFMTLILFAGLQNIPPDVLEAARIDGASAVSMLFRIILPLLRPVIAVALIVRGIDAAKAFDIILIQTEGGPENASQTLSLLIYQTMIRFRDPGLASAMATMYLVVMLLVATAAVWFIWRPGTDQS
jgi:multiple sugar transport system permease protein